jgi:hypothetical protein
MNKTKTKKINFIRHGIIDLSILSELKNGRYGIKNKYKEINGVEVKISSQRYVVFKKSTKCCNCELEGQFFAIEKNKRNNTNKYHLNLYAIDEDGNEVLMTKDHIKPVAKGGKNHIINYQTMCRICNEKKGSDYKEI